MGVLCLEQKLGWCTPQSHNLGCNGWLCMLNIYFFYFSIGNKILKPQPRGCNNKHLHFRGFCLEYPNLKCALSTFNLVDCTTTCYTKCIPLLIYNWETWVKFRFSQPNLTQNKKPNPHILLSLEVRFGQAQIASQISAYFYSSIEYWLACKIHE